MASPARSTTMRMLCGAAKKPSMPSSAGGARSRRRPAKIEREQPDQHGAEQCRQDDDPAGREPRGETGTYCDRHRENGQENGDTPSVPPMLM